MKNVLLLVPVFYFLVSCTATSSQKYKTAADTVLLNKERVEVSNDIADLTSKLTIAQNNLPGYNSKADDAVSDARKSVNASSSQASKATSGDVGDAKSAKKKADKAYDDAKDAEEAQEKVKDQNKKIEKLSSDLQKKHVKMQELDELLARIRASVTQ